MSHTHLNTSDLSDYIPDNAPLTSNLLRTSIYHISSPFILKTVLYSNDVFFDSLDKSMFFIIAILSTTCLCGSNAIIFESFKYLIFYGEVFLLTSFSISLLKPLLSIIL